MTCNFCKFCKFAKLINMWLFTKYGFYSIVKEFNNSNMYQCRARRKKDLENLITNFRYLKGYEIHCDKKADYHYRIFINQMHFSMLMLNLSNTVDYSNFKNWVSKSKDQIDKTESYSEIWEIMYSYQDKNG